MHDSVGVRSGEHTRELRTEYCGVHYRQATATRESLLERFSNKKLHDQKRDAVVALPVVVNMDQPRVLDLRGRNGLAKEACEAFSVFGEVFGQEFHRRRSAEEFVLTEVDFAHSAFAEKTRESVLSNDPPGCMRSLERRPLGCICV